MKLLNLTNSVATQDGDGVNISRVADFRNLTLDPFLMIDELKSANESDYIGGFPPHPHRGIETFTYILEGGFEHRDQMGNRKVIGPGHVQWMSTGFGVVHSEMPVAGAGGMHGFQIWVNMPAKEKLRPARYQDSVATGIPEIRGGDGALLRILAGSWAMAGQQADSPIGDLAGQASVADLRLQPGARATLDRRHQQRLFLYVYAGRINGYRQGKLLLADPATPLDLGSEEGGGALIFSGNPIGEKIVHMGPFVMNSEAEIRQAVEDYQAGKFGTIGG
ncbi:pirin family protein [Ferrimonas sediminicola]|uniref:Pirin family protein n=1 Tax=Ferrimonas sediminicola TaxID=2569538 RepID=A0A4U1BF96_9GAMM|nr:pirin family protein [Ferrimonas sediminicola]TKB48685.1 pirin family protein [Ferrimonas sediminicola]